MPDAGWRLVTLTVGGVADVLAGPQPYALTYCTYHKKDNNIISLMSGSGCRDSCSSSSSCPSSCSFSTAWSCSRGCERALLLLFYALLCFFPSQWVAFPRGVAGMKRGFAAGCALSFSAVKLCVSNVLCLTPPANHLSSTPPRIRHWFTHRVWWAEGGGGRSLKQANGNGSGLHVMLVEVPKRKSRTRPAPCCSITNSTPSYACVRKCAC